jgi:hypothetical protein
LQKGIIVAEKLCIFCENLEMEHQGYGSTWTGAYGEDGFSCKLGHFDEYGKGKVNTVEDMRELFLTAKKCKDYTRE